jgi:hypothetical protein
MKRDPRSVSDLPSDSYRGSEWKRRSARTSVQFLKSALMRADQPLVRNRAVRMYDAIDRELLVKVSSGHHTQPVYIGTAQLCARRDLVPRPVVSIDPVGERRQLRQVIQFNNTFRHRGALSRSGSHRTAGCSHGLRLCCREYSKGRRRRQRQNRALLVVATQPSPARVALHQPTRTDNVPHFAASRPAQVNRLIHLADEHCRSWIVSRTPPQ